MFHEMSFLKQSRREPHKPLSRRRESENKRGEREREDISAFFLHKSLPDRYDGQDRRQPDHSGPSSLDGRMGDDYLNTHERRYSPNQPGLLSQMEDHHARVRDHTLRKESGGSKPSTLISWSTSGPSPGLRESSVSHAQALSPTPELFRGALAQSGIFDNTGIACRNSHGYESTQSGLNSKDGLASARSPTVSQTQGKTPHQGLYQSVRIVHYQDRGTMANEKVMGPEHHFKNPLMQDRSSTSQAQPSDITRPEQSVSMTSANIPVSEASIGLCKKFNTSTNSHDTNMGDQVITPDGETQCFEKAPERPKSPKWALIERLESAAENMKPLYSLPTILTTAQMSYQAPRSVAGNALRSTCSPKTVPTRPVPYGPASIHDTNRLAPEPFLAPVHRDKMSLELSTSDFTTHARTFTEEIPTPYGIPQTQLPIVVHDHRQAKSILPAAIQSESPHAASIHHNRGHKFRQSMQDYIAEIERQSLDEREAGGGSRATSSRETHTMRDSSLAELDAEIEYESAYLQSDVGLSGPSVDQISSSATPCYWAAVTELEEDEEQRFMSSFWRPNRYPI